MKKLIVLLALIMITGCVQTPVKVVEMPKSREIFTLKSEEFSPKISLTGNVEAEKQIPISAKILGRIDSFKVDVGDKVYKGQILARYSAVDNDSLVQYQGALSQFKSTEASAQNSINTAEVHLESVERSLDQTKREESVQRKKQYDNLKTSAKLSEITISNILNFLDKNMEGSNKYRGMNPYENVLGNNNSILKNNLKNQVTVMVREFAGFSKTSPTTERSIINFSEKRLNFIRTLKKTLLEFDGMVRGTVVSNNFSESVKNGFVRETANYLQAVSTTISNLDNLISGTKVMDEQLGLKVLAMENNLESAKSGFELAKSNAENQVAAARSRVNIASTYQREMVVKAPFAGVIISREIDMGQLVSPGQKLFEIADMSGFKVKTDVADSFAGIVKKEMEAEISVDGLTEKFTGIVSKVNPALNPQTRKLGIEIYFIEDEELEESVIDKLKIGLFARIKMQLPTRNVFRIPRNFIKFDYDGAKIMSKDGQILPVEILSEQGNKVEIYFSEIAEDFQITQF